MSLTLVTILRFFGQKAEWKRRMWVVVVVSKHDSTFCGYAQAPRTRATLAKSETPKR